MARKKIRKIIVWRGENTHRIANIRVTEKGVTHMNGKVLVIPRNIGPILSLPDTLTAIAHNNMEWRILK